MQKVIEADIVVVGAGSAGAAAAYHLAGAGFDVVCLDSRPLNESGARWVNAMPPWMFDRAAIARPEYPERVGMGDRLIMITKDLEANATLNPNPIYPTDMRKLVARLQRLATDAGVRFIGEYMAARLDFDGERPVALQAESTRRGGAESLTLRARLYVDASGMTGAIRRLTPQLKRDCPKVQPSDICSAAMEMCDIIDKPAARDWLDRHKAVPGEFVSFTGVKGGFSTACYTVHRDLSSIEVLSGVVSEGIRPSGPQYLAEMKSDKPWIGRAQFGGSGLIPIRRPYDRLAAPGVVLLGDSACHVFPANASGVGAGLIGARILAESLAQFQDPGCLEAVWSYQANTQREVGSLLASFDPFRRLSQTFSEEEVDDLVKSGLVSGSTMYAGIAQALPKPSPKQGLDIVRGIMHSPKLAARMGTAMAKMPLVYALYKNYPQTPDEAALKRFSQRIAKIMGTEPDLA